MTGTEATAEIFWKAFLSLSKRAQEAVPQKTLAQKDFREDLIDIAIIEQRRTEPARPLEEYIEEREKARA
jgi:hypothetical protein